MLDLIKWINNFMEKLLKLNNNTENDKIFKEKKELTLIQEKNPLEENNKQENKELMEIFVKQREILDNYLNKIKLKYAFFKVNNGYYYGLCLNFYLLCSKDGLCYKKSRTGWNRYIMSEFDLSNSESIIDNREIFYLINDSSGLPNDIIKIVNDYKENK